MFFGSFSLFHSDIHIPFLNHLSHCAADDPGFTLTDDGCFRGGYFLNTVFPYSHSDFYFSDEQHDITVLFSGNIYNRHEIAMLYPGLSDAAAPELAAVLFYHQGPSFVEKLNGDFAIFIGREKSREAFLFRDHVGIHPIAWIAEKKNLYFSTDITGLSSVFSATNDCDIEYLQGYFKYIDYRRTPVKGVNKLLPGHYLHFSEQGLVEKRYWYPERNKTDRKLSYEKMISDLKDLVDDSVRIRCDRRFNAGAHVSSGIDSGLVAAMARREYQQQEVFFGFSWSPGCYAPSDIKYDERELVKKYCEKTGIESLFSTLNNENFAAVVSGFKLNQGYFSEDITADLAASRGVNLIFSGWGGDEFISTGDRGIEIDLLRDMRLKLFFRRNPLKRPRMFIKSMARYVVLPFLGIMERKTAKSFRDDARYLKREFKRSDRRAIRDFYFHTSRRAMHLRLLDFYHLQERCESWTMMGQAKGVEYRFPLLDRRIIEYMIRVPSHLLCRNDDFRPLLRVLGEGTVPDEVRLNFWKNDPVHASFMKELFASAAVMFMDEVKSWRENTALSFVDFKLLEEDTERYNKNREEIDREVLHRALVYLKAVDVFTMEMHFSEDHVKA